MQSRSKEDGLKWLMGARFSVHRRSGPARRSSQAGWTNEEDKLLTEVVQRFNGRNWKKIAECMSGRTDVQCLHRWQKEDDCIIELVGKYGSKKWSTIAKYLPGRIGKQCRERWHNHLDPAIKKDAWTEEEEAILAHYHRVLGNRWAEIARFLPGREVHLQIRAMMKKNRGPAVESPILLVKPGTLARERLQRKLMVPVQQTWSLEMLIFSGDGSETKPASPEICGSPEGERNLVEALDGIGLDIVHVSDDRSDCSPVDTFLSLSLCGSSEESQKTEKRSRVCKTPPLVDQKGCGFLCYEPPQLTDLDAPNSSRSTGIDKDIERCSLELFHSYPGANGSNLVSEKCCLHSKDSTSGTLVSGQALERRWNMHLIWNGIQPLLDVVLLGLQLHIRA
ncbi:Transcription factor R-4 [Sesamum angolense]|uniref:Transcription factor R-4 n=1 Tax=Sesamum angolense TaxID=2727404 RepID=A0AAE1W9M7_9LAMI|nr:Transcription factor R-4 [Sesamum angolense]